MSHLIEQNDFGGRAANACLSRRRAIALVAGLGGIVAGLAAPASALAKPEATQETLNALADAKDELAAAEDKLDQISANIADLSRQQSETLDAIDGVEQEIDDTEKEIGDTEKEIAETEEKLAEQQEQLAARVSDTYKNGDQNFLSTLLSTSTFEEFVSTLFYANKISEHDQALIEEVRTTKQQLEDQKAELEDQKAELESKKADLEALNDELEAQLADMKAQKAEAQDLLSSLDGEVKDLIAKRDAEILAAAEAEKEAQRKQSYPVYGSLPEKGSGADFESAAAAQQAIVNACYAVPSPGAGYCAAWVSRVYAAAGLGSYNGNADDMYAWYCHSSNMNDLKVGMIVAVSTHSHTWAGSIYGHVGIYVGNGMIMDNIGYINTQSLNSWLSYYGTTVTPRWGWLGNLDIA